VPSQTQSRMNVWQDYIRYEIDVSKVLKADCICPKLSLMSHWVELIRWYGALWQYSAERHEPAHKMTLKDGRNAFITQCREQSPFSVAFSAGTSESSISRPFHSVGRTALPPAKSSLPVLIWLPP
jgi:hypothetical protein